LGSDLSDDLGNNAIYFSEDQLVISEASDAKALFGEFFKTGNKAEIEYAFKLRDAWKATQ